MESSQVVAEYRRSHNIGEVPIIDMDAKTYTLYGSNGCAYKEVDTNIWMDEGQGDCVAYVGTSRHAGGVVLRPLFIKIGNEWRNAVTGRETDFPRWKSGGRAKQAESNWTDKKQAAPRLGDSAGKAFSRVALTSWKDRCEALTSICESFTWSRNTADLHSHICKSVARVLGSDEVYMNLFVAEGTRRMGVAYHTDGSELYRWEGEYGSQTWPNLRWMLDIEEPFVMNLEEQRIPDLVQSGYVKTGANCAVVVPIQSLGATVGMCFVLFDEMQSIDGEEKDFLALVGRMLGAFVKRIRDARDAFELQELNARRELSGDIRDNVVTLMGSLSLNAAAASASFEDGDEEGLRADLQRLQDTASKATGILSDELSLLDIPLDESQGFVEGMRMCLAQFQTSWGIQTHLDLSQMAERSPVRIVVGLQLTKILGECLSNILKYAQAQNVTVTLSDDSRCFSMIVEDDGVGFDVDELAEGACGIETMKKRAQAAGGELVVLSGENGTSVCVDIPYEKSRWRG